MNKKVFWIICFILLVSTLLVSCTNELKSENETLRRELEEARSKYTDLEKTVGELQNKIALLDMEIIELRETSFSNKGNIHTIYTANATSLNKEVDGHIYIDGSITMRQKLDTLTKVLSEVYFSNLPIQLIRIEEIDSKKIAVINLKESEENQKIDNINNYIGKSWARLYFQGSTGGEVTSTRLIETMLQRDYDKQWIDGVKFLYNNSVIAEEHVPALRDINYR